MYDPLTRDDRLRAQPVDLPAHARLVTVQLREEVRALAWDLIGRPERDELRPEDLAHVESEIDGAVGLVLAVAVADLEHDLTARVEALPLRARLALANARRRRELGFD